MKKTLILLTLLLLAFSGNAFAQKPLTAKQIFMLLPNEYVNGTKIERETALIFPNSIKSDFMTFMISGKLVPKNLAASFVQPEGLGNMRVFKGKSSVIVGLRYQIGDAQEANQTVDKVKIKTILLEYKNGKWTNITDAMLPKASIDYAYKVLSEDFQMKALKKEDVWIEYQINELHKGIMTAARIKGNDSITNLKFFEWNGAKFVESEN